MENGKTIGSVNILRDKAWYFEGSLADPNKAQPVPEDMTDIVAEYKNQIAEAIAMSDDELMEKYFSGEEFSEHGADKRSTSGCAEWRNSTGVQRKCYA